MSRYDDLNKVWEDRGYKSYAAVTDKPKRWLLRGGIVAVLVLAAIVLGGWQIGWWFRNQNINRESHAIRNSYGNQQTLREQVTSNIGNVLMISTQLAETGDASTKAALAAQRRAIVAMVCQSADAVVGDPLPTDQASFVKANCEAGNVNPASIYN